MRNLLNPGKAFNQHEELPPVRYDILVVPMLLVMAMWLSFWLDYRYVYDLYRFGIYPREWSGLVGIISSPIIHGSVNHLLGNTLPVLILGSGLYYFYPKIAGQIIIWSWLSLGLAVWLVARPSYHIGASGIIYALAAFLFLSGILRGKANLLAFSLLIAFLYGGLFWGLLPVEEKISYEAHAAGAFSGFALAIVFRANAPRSETKKPEADNPEEEDLSEQIAKYGEGYWKENQAGDDSRPAVIRYHYLPREKNQEDED